MLDRTVGTTTRKPSARWSRADPLRALVPRVLAGPCFLHPASPFHPPGPHRSPALPLVGRRDGLPAKRLRGGQDACRSPDGERPGRGGGVNRECVSSHERGCPGGMKGRGGLREPRTDKHRSGARSAVGLRDRSAPRAFDVFASSLAPVSLRHQIVTDTPYTDRKVIAPESVPSPKCGPLTQQGRQTCPFSSPVAKLGP
mgnify:CR=1 FL=1